MSVIDLVFPVQGTIIPTDHGYALYAAVSRLLGEVSHETNGLGFFHVQGQPAKPGMLSLTAASRLRIRTPLEFLPRLIQLSGKRLDIDGQNIRLGVPQAVGLEPRPTLRARIVTIKGFQEPDSFLAAVQRQLDGLGVKATSAIPVRHTGPHEGEPVRRVLRIRGKKVVGFALQVTDLNPENSILLQEQGIGGRRHMGCGLFLPDRDPEGSHGL